MIIYTQMFEISALGALFGAYMCELYFWAKTHSLVRAQAKQATQEEIEKRNTKRKECLICTAIVITFLFACLDFTSIKVLQSHEASADWTIEDEAASNMLLDPFVALLLGCFFFIEAIGLSISTKLTLNDLKSYYSLRYKQFKSPIVSCAVWSIVAVSVMTLRLVLEAVLRPILNSGVDNLVEGNNGNVYIVVWMVGLTLSDCFAQIALIISMHRRYLIWLDRLHIFPLGLPDGVTPPPEELLAALKEEIEKNRFKESLLEQSEIMSLAKAHNF